MAWGLLPLFYASAGLTLVEIGVLPRRIQASRRRPDRDRRLVDRVGRKPLIVCGMLLQAAAIAAIAMGSIFAVWLVASVVLGFGTAMVYPTLLATIAEVADPAWRGSAIGVFRLWRDLGFCDRAVVAGVIADSPGMPAAIGAVAALTAASGLVVLVRMRETFVRSW
jgi:MFS family permease